MHTLISGGQRQRLEIARVLAQAPSIIILDEATITLDAKNESAVVNAIKAWGITCIVIAHRLLTVKDCSRILVLDHDRIAEEGDYDLLIAKQRLFAGLIERQQI